ncbi:MAG: hypothetical protein GEU96_19260 [Propionibacteriales bacterium]|nr:hypothetical protein [Propionibacteriales bacterium]
MTRAALLVVHALVAAVWLGGMVYSLAVVQPKMAAFFAGAADQHESFAATLASGNRWKVLGLVAALALSGLALLAYDGSGPLAVHLVKGILLLAATAVFVWVSWRHWTRRVFALADERPALTAQLRVAALSMVGLVGTAFVLSVVQR